MEGPTVHQGACYGCFDARQMIMGDASNGHSTGPYTASRHLGRHFILAKIPSHCSGPVSSNVGLEKH